MPPTSDSIFGFSTSALLPLSPTEDAERKLDYKLCYLPPIRPAQRTYMDGVASKDLNLIPKKNAKDIKTHRMFH